MTTKCPESALKFIYISGSHLVPSVASIADIYVWVFGSRDEFQKLSIIPFWLLSQSLCLNESCCVPCRTICLLVFIGAPTIVNLCITRASAHRRYFMKIARPSMRRDSELVDQIVICCRINATGQKMWSQLGCFAISLPLNHLVKNIEIAFSLATWPKATCWYTTSSRRHRIWRIKFYIDPVN